MIIDLNGLKHEKQETKRYIKYTQRTYKETDSFTALVGPAAQTIPFT